MNGVISNLQNLVESGEQILGELNASISNEALRQFLVLAEQYVDLYAKSKLLQDIQDDRIIENCKPKELSDLIAKRKEMESELKSIQETREHNGETAENLSNLIEQSKMVIEVFQQNSPSVNSNDYNSLIDLCNEELKKLEEIEKAYKWYDAAYQKLSNFTGIQVVDLDNHIYMLLDRYKLQIADNKFTLLENDVYTGDLDLSTMSVGECLAQIFERLYALEDMQQCAQQLGWSLSVLEDAPLCTLMPPNSTVPAIVALIGSAVHPLVEWGNVPIFDFNETPGTMEQKFRKFAGN